VTGQLSTYGDDDDARCVFCGALAAGDCARCQRSVCGDCCVLTSGGIRTWAICLDCQERGGQSLRAEWMTVAGWVVIPILLLLAAAVAYVTWMH